MISQITLHRTPYLGGSKFNFKKLAKINMNNTGIIILISRLK